jgi:phosphoglycolate phosphatase-like HAD superfamily hydrolase
MMPATDPTLLALDFDGVVCDGMLEYFQAAWRTYCQIWQPHDSTPPADLAPQFYRLRPVVETGWEMPIVIRSLLDGIPESEIFQDWPNIAQKQVQKYELTAAEVGQKLDHLRDTWIATDLEDWLSYHRFYPGVIQRIQEILETSVKVFIITTKEGRFVKQLLQQAGLDFPESRIYGKENKRPKHQILRELLTNSQNQEIIWFVEDRLKTLQSVQQQPDLKTVKLFLADWGYNTVGDREIATNNPYLQLLSLDQFSQNFSEWPV